MHRLDLLPARPWTVTATVRGTIGEVERRMPGAGTAPGAAR